MSPADTLQAIQRQTTYLQQEIQALLDAQSLGLSTGLGQESDAEDDRSYNKESVGPIHLPVSSVGESFSQTSSARTPRRLSLATSRKTLYLTLIQLSELKREESSALSLQHEALNGFLANTTKVEDKKAQIESSIAEIEAKIEDSDGSLAGEEAALVSEIAELQKKLDESTSRLKHVRSQRQESSNRQRAKLSSWQGALDGVQQQIQTDVLSGSGLEEIIGELRIRKKQHTHTGVWGLSKERRTVSLIKDDIKERAEKLSRSQEAAELEGIACANGAEMWATVVEKVEIVEQALSREVHKPVSTTMDQADADTGMIKIIHAMTDTIDYLEKELDSAETKHWNLLICAVGAELEAMKQGKDLLQDALEAVQVQDTSGTLSMMTAKSRLASDLTDSDGTTHLPDHLFPRNGSIHLAKNTQLVDTSDVDSNTEPRGSTAQNSQQFSHELSQTVVQPHMQSGDDEDEDTPGPEFFVE